MAVVFYTIRLRAYLYTRLRAGVKAGLISPYSNSRLVQVCRVCADAYFAGPSTGTESHIQQTSPKPVYHENAFTASYTFFKGKNAPDLILVGLPSDHAGDAPQTPYSQLWGWGAFSVAGPSLWNSLQDSLRDPDLGRYSFRRLLTTHLYTLC